MANLLKSLTPRTAQCVRSIFLTAIRSDANRINPNMHKVSNFEKKMLVWTKKYKSVEEVPSVLPAEIVDKARNRTRIRLANWMMFVTLIACIAVSISGRRLRDKGETLTKMNLEWHARMNEQFNKDNEEKKEKN